MGNFHLSQSIYCDFLGGEQVQNPEETLITFSLKNWHVIMNTVRIMEIWTVHKQRIQKCIGKLCVKHNQREMMEQSYLQCILWCHLEDQPTQPAERQKRKVF